MSIRDDRRARRARKNADKDLTDAKKAARKAFDLKDPRFLGEAAIAATRGPVGLALFGASRGLDVARERRSEQTEALRSLAHDAKEDAKTSAAKDRKDAARERKAVEKKLARKRRRFSPLWLTGLVGGALVAGGTAWFLRDGKSSSPAPTPAAQPTPAPAAAQSMAAAAQVQAAGVSPEASGADLVVDAPDPEGPAGQSTGTLPAPGAAAGSAPQPEPGTDGEDPAARP